MPRKSTKPKKRKPGSKTQRDEGSLLLQLGKTEVFLPFLFNLSCVALAEASALETNLKEGKQSHWLQNDGLLDSKARHLIKKIIDATEDYFERHCGSVMLYHEQIVIEKLLALFQKTKELKGDSLRQEMTEFLSKNLIKPTEENIKLLLKQIDPKSKFSADEVASYGSTKEGARLLATLLVRGTGSLTGIRNQYKQLEGLNTSDLGKLAIRQGRLISQTMLDAKYRMFKSLGVSDEALEVIKKDDRKSG